MMGNLNLTEKELQKYEVLGVYQDFENINMIRRMLMTLDVNQSF